ncbi:membrane protein [Nostoc linckia z15]|jgi:cbb3-type cytochrome oxidase subunit 3|nr:membrane protein [Nostoc linckia z15]
MFSQGQIYFAIFFIIVFVAAMVYVYRKDLPLHKMHYKGTYWILLGFLCFVAFLFVMKAFIKE